MLCTLYPTTKPTTRDIYENPTITPNNVFVALSLAPNCGFRARPKWRGCRTPGFSQEARFKNVLAPLAGDHASGFGNRSHRQQAIPIRLVDSLQYSTIFFSIRRKQSCLAINKVSLQMSKAANVVN